MNDTVEKTLALRERELDLLLAIDTVRDAVDDDVPPGVMFERLLTLLLEHLAANAAAIVVISDEQNGIEYQSAMSIEPRAGFSLCQEVLKATDRPEIMPVDAAGYGDGLGVRIMMDGEPLAGVVLLREPQDAPFSEDDVALLQTAENQIDSAIVQVRRIWRLKQRNRELDVIYRLDQLRDRNTNENDLITAFTQIILEQYNAQLCMVILSHIDSGDMVVRGIVDKIGLKPADFDRVMKTVENLEGTRMVDSPRDGVEMIAAPFLIAGMQLGAVVVGRERSFHSSDLRLLFALSSQMDSAIVYSRVIAQLSQRNKELEIIYNIDKIRDSDEDFDVMLQSVLGELCQAIDTDISFILLFNDREEDQLEIKSSTSSGILTSRAYYEAIQRVSRQALETGDMVFENNLAGEVRSTLSVPLVLHDRIIGVFGGLNSNSSLGFTAENRRMLKAIVTQVDTAVFERMEQRRVRQVLGRSVDPKVLDYLLEHGDAASVLAGERRVVSVLFADLRGSTEWAERTEPDTLAYTLNQYLGRMTDVIFEYGGTLDKFVGDEVIGLFGAPLPMEDHAYRCTAAAYRMQEVMAEMRQELSAQGYELPPMGVGVSTGEAICGEFGTEQRTDYTAMGRMMNLGARLCSAAKGGEVVISEQTQIALGEAAKIERMEDVTLKGIGQATAYKLLKMDTKL
ncbi:MAG: adenylate/guanylate cyclase domain-containing protein [Chloroflexota bacterium]